MALKIYKIDMNLLVLFSRRAAGYRRLDPKNFNCSLAGARDAAYRGANLKI
jgi:hypothetical protein